MARTCLRRNTGWGNSTGKVVCTGCRANNLASIVDRRDSQACKGSQVARDNLADLRASQAARASHKDRRANRECRVSLVDL